ncbi:MAG: hypothetical protein GY856_25625 [bacterium]|nr:hypothetical protein [bacterium]
MSPFRRFAIALILLVVATPTWAYIVYLKDGSQIVTKEKYRVVGDQAYLILPSGTETSMNVSEIDVAKTDELNQVDIGTARVLEGVGTRTTPEPSEAEVDRETLGDLLGGRSGLSLPPVSKRQEAVAMEVEALPLTKAGFVDLMKLSRNPYTDSEITTELLQYLKGQGVEEIKIYQGTAADSPLIEIVTNSEASVFKVLKDCANALVQMHGRFPEKVGALEVLMVTGSQVRAGQFVLTPAMGNLLVTGAIDAPTFFCRHVQF